MVENSPTVLFGDADLEGSRLLRERLKDAGIFVLAAGSSRELLELAERRHPDVIILDDRLESIGSQVFVSLLRRHCPTTRIILLMPGGTHPDHEALRHLEPICSLVRPISDTDLARVITAALRGAVPSGEGKLPIVLCVDDDALFLKSLVRILRHAGYAAIPCATPEEALEAIPIHRPHLAFIDVLMPGMNGLDLASEIRDHYGDDLPLVLLSGRTSDREITEGYRSGADTYLTKPSEPQTILRVAADLIRRSPNGKTVLLRPTP
ncbi:MAG TPA: response regulator [Planctomycetota bacterium]|nr:response regulator [Planctomycetota bacterium]